MTNYRRADLPGAAYFFTVNLVERKGNTLLTDRIDELRLAFRYVKQGHPFHIDAIVILPEHLHCLWTLPPDDANFSMRWNLIKGRFSRSIGQGERRSKSRTKRREQRLPIGRIQARVGCAERLFAKRINRVILLSGFQTYHHAPNLPNKHHAPQNHGNSNTANRQPFLPIRV